MEPAHVVEPEVADASLPERRQDVPLYAALRGGPARSLTALRSDLGALQEVGEVELGRSVFALIY